MSANLAEELYALAHSSKTYVRFMDLLADMNEFTSINARQLDILIKIDFFSDFGNQRELLRITELFDGIFKKGSAVQIKKSQVDGTKIGEIISKYAVGVTKSGGVAKNYTLLDIKSIMRETEDAIKAVGMDDLSDLTKVRNFYEAMGYIGYISGKQEDRRKLYILDIYPLKRKADGHQFGYSIITKSIGSGKESRFTVKNNAYRKLPIIKGDVILCKEYARRGQYFDLISYEKVI